MPAIRSHFSCSQRSNTPQVKAPCEPPPCRARSTSSGGRSVGFDGASDFWAVMLSHCRVRKPLMTQPSYRFSRVAASNEGLRIAPKQATLNCQCHVLGHPQPLKRGQHPADCHQACDRQLDSGARRHNCASNTGADRYQRESTTDRSTVQQPAIHNATSARTMPRCFLASA